jgi:16S rRNA A1518/A1519 N6-dimethyltransferase RsmA/KsgA/DIM1 with predicted DNA glycosylase/AP lyase activity
MGKLFLHEVDFFEDQIRKIKMSHDKCALVEVGFGTAELQAKVMDDCDMIVGVELSQTMIDLAYKLHENLK